jgi:hypothetical protein
MSFSKIGDSRYLIEEDGEKLQIIFEKFLYHCSSCALSRETETKETVNLFNVLNDIRDIVKSYKKDKPEVHEIFFHFFQNERIDTQRWTNVCEFYLKRQPEIKVSKMGPVLVLRFLE